MMGRQSLRRQLFDREFDGECAAFRIRTVIRCARGLGEIWRDELMEAHFFACYHYAQRENEQFNDAVETLEKRPFHSPFKDRSELVSHYCGGTPLTDRAKTSEREATVSKRVPA